MTATFEGQIHQGSTLANASARHSWFLTVTIVSEGSQWTTKSVLLSALDYPGARAEAALKVTRLARALTGQDYLTDRQAHLKDTTLNCCDAHAAASEARLDEIEDALDATRPVVRKRSGIAISG